MWRPKTQRIKLHVPIPTTTAKVPHWGHCSCPHRWCTGGEQQPQHAMLQLLHAAPLGLISDPLQPASDHYLPHRERFPSFDSNSSIWTGTLLLIKIFSCLVSLLDMLEAAWQAYIVVRLQNLACCWMLPLHLIYLLSKKLSCSCDVSWFNNFQYSYVTDVLHGQ